MAEEADSTLSSTGSEKILHICAEATDALLFDGIVHNSHLSSTWQEAVNSLYIYMIRDTHDSIRKDGTRVLLLPVFLAFLGRHAGAIHSVLIG